MSATGQNLWIDGERLSQLDINDRAIQYGDGFFTTVAVFEQQILNWSAHRQRLQNSFAKLQINPIDLSQIEIWLVRALQTYFVEDNPENAVAKILISRGQGGIGYQIPSEQKPRCLIYIKPTPKELLQNGSAIKAKICQTQASIQPFAGIKHLNRLENVMARAELLKSPDYSEGLMLNANKHVICGTQSNLFFIASTLHRENKILSTPKLNYSGVCGTTRQGLIELLGEHGWQLNEADFKIDAVKQAKELFFCNAVRGIQPVDKLCLYDESIEFDTTAANGLQKLWNDWQYTHGLPIGQIDKEKI